jgi:hypothetical protein
MPDFSERVQMDPRAMSTQLMFKARDEYVRRLIGMIDAQIGPCCCAQHRAETLHSSVMVTGFMMLAAGLSKMRPGITDAAMERALSTIRAELLDGAVPVSPATTKDVH